MRLKGRTALVTGAGNSVGAATARLLAAEGASVLVTDRDGSRAAAVAAEILQSAGHAAAMEHDPVSEDSWRRVTRDCVASLGGLHLLVNAAQSWRKQSIRELGVEQFMALFDASGLATWLGQKHGIEVMRAAGGGVIVNVTTVLARVAAPDSSAACAAARGVLMSTKSAALECARNKANILVNAVLAGRIDGDPEHFPDGSVLPHAVPVSPDDVAQAVLFYATDGAAYMTGTELPVDGGFLAE